jgi:NAD(P)-dependent dehydrogenase (short-subunit alcohol dehydrogenase family)
MTIASQPPRSILITGASSGIGHHAAHALHTRGWKVIAAARKPDDVSCLRDEGLNSVHLDYADEASIAAAFETTLDQTGGRLDALFNNGAYGQVGALEDVSTEHMRAQFEANFFGIHRLTQLALPVMRAQGAGASSSVPAFWVSSPHPIAVRMSPRNLLWRVIATRCAPKWASSASK